ncbi:MAG: YeiH family protein [Bacteroidia bacterium]
MSFFSRENAFHTLKGILFVSLFAIVATLISNIAVVRNLGFSPLIIGILVSMVYGNTLRHKLPQKWVMGILFSAKFILRAAIIFYGFRITFTDLISIGAPGLVQSLIMVTTTFLIGSFIGIRVFKMDKDTAYLTASGAAVCGAAAVLATESVLKSEPHKSAIAVTTVVLFGTISMFFYPVLQKSGVLPFDEAQYGIYIGGSIHEVAQVVAAGNAVGPKAASTSIIVKMTRVMLLGPMLIILGLFLTKRSREKIAVKEESRKKKMVVPWFVFGFILVAGFNTLQLIPKNGVGVINTIDTFLLTMAMCALGMETNFAKFKAAGAKPVYLAAILFAWLLVGGFLFTQLIGRFL